MTLAIIFAVALMIASVLIHYETLRLTSDYIPRMLIGPQTRILVVLTAIMFVHVAVISLYALAYYMMSVRLGIGSMHGEFKGEALDYFYFSATTYTTLGVGDVFARGPIRVVSGLQSLTGLVMIAWSATFTYLHMERFWSLHHK